MRLFRLGGNAKYPRTHPSTSLSMTFFVIPKHPINPPLRRAGEGDRGGEAFNRSREGECMYVMAIIAYPDLSGYNKLRMTIYHDNDITIELLFS